MSREQEYSDEELLEELRRIFLEQGIVLPSTIQEHGEISLTTITSRFGTLKEAKEEAGIDDKAKVFKDWEKELKGRYGRIEYKELKEEILPNFNGLWFHEFLEWVNNRDKIHVREPKQNSNADGRSKIFVKEKGKDFKEIMLERYGDRLPEEYEEMFFHYLSQGYSPKTIVGTIDYITSDQTQSDIEITSNITIRNFIKTVQSDGEYADMIPDDYQQIP